jgi:hypothetical protein
VVIFAKCPLVMPVPINPKSPRKTEVLVPLRGVGTKEQGTKEHGLGSREPGVGGGSLDGGIVK